MRRSERVTWDQVRVGLLILVALSILAVGIFLVGRTGNVFGDRYRLVTLMGSAAGLVPGAVVQVAGQPVGQVDEVQLIPPEERPASGEAVAVWLAVDRSVRGLIRADSEARVRTQGLLGDRLIDIAPGSAGRPVLQAGDTLRAADALNYQELLDTASGAVISLTELVRDLTELTERAMGGEGSLGQLVVNDTLYHGLVDLSAGLSRVLERVDRGEGFLGRALEDEALYDRLVSVTAGLDSLTSAVAGGEGTLGRLVRSDSLYESLTRMAGRSDSLLGALRAGEGAMGRLLTEDALYEELLRTVVDLNAVLQDLRENPRKYIPPVTVF